MNNSPLVSVVIPTKNEENNIAACLKSIKEQTYKYVEIIVVDNKSTDSTQKIAKRYTQFIYSRGPERSSQRNFGAQKAQGKYILFIDADMQLEKNVIEDCINKCKNVVGIIIPEESFGNSFWAKCKQLERSFYVGEDLIEAARFFSRNQFLKLNGYDQELVSGEDWDLSQRMRKVGRFARVNTYIFHNEGDIKLLDTIRKKFYYAKHISRYQSKSANYIYQTKQMSVIYRYKLFFAKPLKLFKNPLLGFGMLFMKTVEFFFGGMGFLFAKLKTL